MAGVRSREAARRLLEPSNRDSKALRDTYERRVTSRAATRIRAKICFALIDRLERQGGRLSLRAIADHGLICGGVWRLLGAEQRARGSELVYWRRLGRTDRGDRYAASLSHVPLGDGRTRCGVEIASSETHELAEGVGPRGVCERCRALDGG